MYFVTVGEPRVAYASRNIVTIASSLNRCVFIVLAFRVSHETADFEIALILNSPSSEGPAEEPASDGYRRGARSLATHNGAA